MLTPRKTMDVVAVFEDVGTYRGAAEICGVDPRTVKRKVLARGAGELDDERAARAPVPKNTDVARQLVAQRVEATRAKITAKRLLPEAQSGVLCRFGPQLQAPGCCGEEDVACPQWPSAPQHEDLEVSRASRTDCESSERREEAVEDAKHAIPRWPLTQDGGIAPVQHQHASFRAPQAPWKTMLPI